MTSAPFPTRTLQQTHSVRQTLRSFPQTRFHLLYWAGPYWKRRDQSRGINPAQDTQLWDTEAEATVSRLGCDASSPSSACIAFLNWRASAKTVLIMAKEISSTFVPQGFAVLYLNFDRFPGMTKTIIKIMDLWHMNVVLKWMYLYIESGLSHWKAWGDAVRWLRMHLVCGLQSPVMRTSLSTWVLNMKCKPWIDKDVGSDCRASVFGTHVAVCASARVWPFLGGLLPS